MLEALERTSTIRDCTRSTALAIKPKIDCNKACCRSIINAHSHAAVGEGSLRIEEMMSEHSSRAILTQAQAESPGKLSAPYTLGQLADAHQLQIRIATRRDNALCIA